MKAKKNSWKVQEAPNTKEKLELNFTCTSSEYEKIQNGFVPKAMEDKWFIFFQDEWLYFHRSWTGHLIFWLNFKEDVESAFVVESWVNRDTDQYKSDDIGYDQLMVKFLINTLLLDKQVEFPITKSQTSASSSLAQHSALLRWEYRINELWRNFIKNHAKLKN